ncbi:MAG TPA: MmcQ/YjbR family DNA-binding protein [Beutenbergiaceae bacterium]|nr:MmcQ/YjbR family DNA-binding protein [Beutenbergiaceae bacterium]
MTLSGGDLQRIARERAAALPKVSHGRPFTPNLDVYKVVDKVFLIVTDDPEEQIITVKAEPADGHALRQEYAAITPGRYLDKRHWISIGSGSGITKTLVHDLVEDSYELVVDQLPGRDGESRG